MDKFNIEFEGMSVKGSYDGDSDGKNSLELSLNLKEVYEEIADKGETTVDAVISLKREGGVITVSVDTDKDGQAVLGLKADILEGIKEAF